MSGDYVTRQKVWILSSWAKGWDVFNSTFLLSPPRRYMTYSRHTKDISFGFATYLTIPPTLDESSINQGLNNSYPGQSHADMFCWSACYILKKKYINVSKQGCHVAQYKRIPLVCNVVAPWIRGMCSLLRTGPTTKCFLTPDSPSFVTFCALPLSQLPSCSPLPLLILQSFTPYTVIKCLL